MTTRITVSLSDEDTRVLDAYIRERNLPGRSAGVQAAIHLISVSELAAHYEQAFAEDDGAEWDLTVNDTE